MASAISSSTPSTPKRKHRELSDGSNKPLPTLNTTKFSFDLNNTNALPEDGSSSPRTKVAHKFRGLAIDGGDSGSHRGVARGATTRVPGTSTSTRTSTPDADEVMRDDDDDSFSRKRVKLPERPPPTTPKLPDGFKMAAEQPNADWADGLRARLDPAIVRSSKTANRSQRSSSHGPNKPRRRRSGTPPLTPFIKPQASATAPGEATAAVASTGTDSTPNLGSGSASCPKGDPEDDTQPHVVDPVRAALTWHEDEITIYDPNDEDDDGTGINGIGFRPTATIAYTRLVRRKQQIAEYKKREEQEARALRSQRRRRDSGSSTAAPTESTGASEAAAAAAQARRVHFMDVEPVTVITT